MQGLLVARRSTGTAKTRLILVGLVGTAIGFVLLTRSWNLVSLTAFVVLNMAGGALVRPDSAPPCRNRPRSGKALPWA